LVLWLPVDFPFLNYLEYTVVYTWKIENFQQNK